MITEVTTGPRRHGPWLLLLAFCLTACAGQPAVRRPAAAAPVTSENPPPLADAGFEAWLEDFKAEALSKGISQATVSRAFVGVTPNDRVVELDRKQPEGTITFERYFANTVTDARVKRGRALLDENRATLDSVAATYGVPAKVVVALWGVESGFGANMGKLSIVRSLATLAYEGRRAAFFRDELTNALRIMDQEGFGTDKLVGSWAGAMGQCQFMPSSYLKWAVDFDGDGHRDIWATRADVFGSAANYLKQNGWKAGESWGRPVVVPAGLAKSNLGLQVKKSLAEWAALGVRQADGSPLPVADLSASLINPGDGARYFLVYDNFRVVMRWNKSTYFATSVLSLADRIGGSN